MNDFTRGNTTKQILLFSIPMLIGNLFQQAYSIVDAIVVGRFIGGSALAAVGVSMNVIQFLLATLIGLTTGASVVISQFYGAKEFDRLERTVSTSILFLAGFSVLLTISGIILSPVLLRGLNASDDIFTDAIIYLQVQMAGIVFPVFYNMYTAYMRALGDSRSPLYILLCSTILNTVLDLVFVLQFGWKIRGVAVATVISQAVAAILCYWYTRKYLPLLQVKAFTFDWKLCGLILKYGTPAALQLSLVSLASLTITRLINSFGAVAMAGITAVSRIDQLAILPVSSLSMALSTFVAQNLGAGSEDRAKKGFRSALILMVALAAGTSVLLMGFGPRLISMFLDQNNADTPQIMRIGLDYMNIMVVFYFLFAFLFGFNGFFRGAGDAVIAMVFPVASLTIRTVSAYLLVGLADMGPEALAWSIPIGWGLCSLFSWFYYRKRLWAGKTVVSSPSPEKKANEANT